MNHKRMEALCDAIADLNSYSDPASEAYQLRNPGLLRAKTLASLATATDDCLRRFSNHKAGRQALEDVLGKRIKYNPDEPINRLISDRGHKDSVEYAIRFINLSLAEKVQSNTKLRFFMEQ